MDRYVERLVEFGKDWLDFEEFWIDIESLKEFWIDIECDWKISGEIDCILDEFWKDWLDIRQSLVSLREIGRILDMYGLDIGRTLVRLRDIGQSLERLIRYWMNFEGIY